MVSEVTYIESSCPVARRWGWALDQKLGDRVGRVCRQKGHPRD